VNSPQNSSGIAEPLLSQMIYFALNKLFSEEQQKIVLPIPISVSFFSLDLTLFKYHPADFRYRLTEQERGPEYV
jgi:hypothetical protein